MTKIKGVVRKPSRFANGNIVLVAAKDISLTQALKTSRLEDTITVSRVLTLHDGDTVEIKRTATHTKGGLFPYSIRVNNEEWHDGLSEMQREAILSWLEETD